MIHRVVVGVRGVTPLLMHAFPLVPIDGVDKMTPADQAEHAAYRDPETRHLYVPATAVFRGLIDAGAFSRGKGRASLTRIVAACCTVSPERIDLGVTEYAVDSRSVVVPATRGRVIRHRPRLDHWQCRFTLDYDARLLSERHVRTIVDDMCSRVGLLDFRPATKGPFGRAMVVSWDTCQVPLSTEDET